LISAAIPPDPVGSHGKRNERAQQAAPPAGLTSGGPDESVITGSSHHIEPEECGQPVPARWCDLDQTE